VPGLIRRACSYRSFATRSLSWRLSLSQTQNLKPDIFPILPSLFIATPFAIVFRCLRFPALVRSHVPFIAIVASVLNVAKRHSAFSDESLSRSIARRFRHLGGGCEESIDPGPERSRTSEGSAFEDVFARSCGITCFRRQLARPPSTKNVAWDPPSCTELN